MLKCIQYFRQGLWEFGEGDFVNQHPALEDWLADSYPAHFVRADAPVIEPEIEPAPAVADEVPTEDEAQPEVVAADIAEPPADKAIKRPRGRK